MMNKHLAVGNKKEKEQVQAKQWSQVRKRMTMRQKYQTCQTKKNASRTSGDKHEKEDEKKAWRRLK